MKTLGFLLLFIIISFIASKIEEINTEKRKCSNYLTGKIRYSKTINGPLIEVEHFKKSRKFFKQATKKEIRYIKSLK